MQRCRIHGNPLNYILFPFSETSSRIVANHFGDRPPTAPRATQMVCRGFIAIPHHFAQKIIKIFIPLILLSKNARRCNRIGGCWKVHRVRSGRVSRFYSKPGQGIMKIILLMIVLSKMARRCNRTGDFWVVRQDSLCCYFLIWTSFCQKRIKIIVPRFCCRKRHAIATA